MFIINHKSPAGHRLHRVPIESSFTPAPVCPLTTGTSLVRMLPPRTRPREELRMVPGVADEAVRGGFEGGFASTRRRRSWSTISAAHASSVGESMSPMVSTT